MKTSLNIFSFAALGMVLFFFLSIPGVSKAQRFNHSNFGGGSRGYSAPAQNVSRPAPAASRTTPVENRPAQPMVNRAPQPQPQPVEQRRTINGGSYNTGNHDYNPNSVATRTIVNTHENVTAQRNMNVHENVNVYHNHYQPSHAYSYHPYHPYYWGHNWHPFGYIAASLAADAFLFSIANQQYYYDDGVYYEPASGGYAVVAAPIGATVSSLPPGYETHHGRR